MIPNPNDERLLKAISEVSENNIKGLGTFYTDYEYRFGLAIADAKAGSSPNYAKYTDYEYRFGLAVADVSLSINPRWNYYTPIEFNFAIAIASLISQGFIIGTATTNTIINQLNFIVGSVLLNVSTANTLSNGGLLTNTANSQQSASTANTSSNGGVLIVQTLHPDTISYQNNIITTGGNISNSDLMAIDEFTKTIYANNLRSLFKAFYPYAGENLLTAREGLWIPSGVNTQLGLVGNSFTDANYSKTIGITGNGSQGFDVGFSSSSQNFEIDWSYSVYLRSNGDRGSSQIGTGSAASDYLAQNFGFVTYYSSSSGFVDTTDEGWYTAQYQSALRNGIETNTTSGNIGANSNIYIHGRNLSETLHQGTSRSIGCVAIGTTKTPTQELIIYNAVQTLMTAFGRSV